MHTQIHMNLTRPRMFTASLATPWCDFTFFRQGSRCDSPLRV